MRWDAAGETRVENSLEKMGQIAWRERRFNLIVQSILNCSCGLRKHDWTQAQTQKQPSASRSATCSATRQPAQLSSRSLQCTWFYLPPGPQHRLAGLSPSLTALWSPVPSRPSSAVLAPHVAPKRPRPTPSPSPASRSRPARAELCGGQHEWIIILLNNIEWTSMKDLFEKKIEYQ